MFHSRRHGRNISGHIEEHTGPLTTTPVTHSKDKNRAYKVSVDVSYVLKFVFLLHATVTRVGLTHLSRSWNDRQVGKVETGRPSRDLNRTKEISCKRVSTDV